MLATTSSIPSQQAPPAPSSSLSSLSLSVHNHANPIDLTGDDDDVDQAQDSSRQAKRIRIDEPFRRDTSSTPALFASRSPSKSSASPMSSYSSFGDRSATAVPSSFDLKPSIFTNTSNDHSTVHPESYRPPFVGPSTSSAFFPNQQMRSPITASHTPSSASSYSASSRSSSRSVIDLTGSPSPPPQPQQYHFQNGDTLPPDLDQRTPVCLGQLTVTALVLYPVSYIIRDPTSNEPEWVPVKLTYERNPHENSETIHIKLPGPTTVKGVCDSFAVVEQKVASIMGGMLGRGLIRLDAHIKKEPPNHPILSLRLLVYTPKGNIPAVGNFLFQRGLLLDHPVPPYDLMRFGAFYYHNPHNPPPGGHSQIFHANNRTTGYQIAQGSRWSSQQVSSKSVDVQRSQVDELFRSMKDGDELTETEAGSEIATTLYPHQKKALTFLLEREREKPGSDGTYSSLWQRQKRPVGNRDYWVHLVTQKEADEEPLETKGAILADDMGLGKTITCVSLIAATLPSAKAFTSTPVEMPNNTPEHIPDAPDASQFSGSVWGMPDMASASAKAKAKALKLQEKLDADMTRASRIKAKSRATLIICPLSTVSNWEDQFREHWKGEVFVVGGAGGVSPTPSASSTGQLSLIGDAKANAQSGRVRQGTSLRVYIYHGNARRPEPTFLADFDAVITTYATLASEYSKQNRSIANAEAEEEEDSDGETAGGVDFDEYGNQILRLPKAKKAGTKRKKTAGICASEATSALQSIHWFRVVLDEAHCIKETGTVGSRASCDLVADRRLCLTGTPVQNKLDDVFALIKFLRLKPLDDKNVWTEFIGSPVKFGQTLGVVRLQTIMKCITLRRTKETKTLDGKKILSLPPRRDELRLLRFDAQEQGIYDQFFNESKAEFAEMSDKNEVMKNYVGILQKILRLRQICDHFELVENKGFTSEDQSQGLSMSYEEAVAAIEKEGLNPARATTIFNLLKESGTTQCVGCSAELCAGSESQTDSVDDAPAAPKRPKKSKNASSRVPTRANSPSLPKAILTRCQHLFCLGCYRICVCPNWPDESLADAPRACPICQTALQHTDALEIKVDPAPECSTTPKKKALKREKRPRGQAFNPSTKVKALLGDLIQFSRANPYSVNYDPNSIEIQMVDDQGNQLDDGIVKTVVFSQWTTMLDKVEDALEATGIRYDRLDGTMKRDDRTRAMDALKHDPSVEVLLVSLKAGGVGLNLTAAQRVYLMDPYWNPAVENQAVDRIHRLGQTKPVTTVKLIIEGSIESRLLEVQKKKTELANMTLGGQNFTKAEMMQRRVEELQELFKQ